MSDGGEDVRERHDRFGERKRALFLEALGETCNVRHSAARAGIAKTTAYQTYRKDPEFAGRWMEALSLGYVRLEEKLLAHALRQVDGGDGDGGGDGGGAEPAFGASECTGATAGTSFTDARLALALLNRHAASVQGGRMSPVKGRRKVTAEETDAALCKLLDQLAKKIAKEGRA